MVGSWHHDRGVGTAQGIRWTADYTLCIVGTAVPTLRGGVAGHRLHEERPGQRGCRQYGSIEPAAPPGLPHRPGQGDKKGKRGRRDGAARINITPGLRVSIVLKPDQRSGTLTEGVVKDIFDSLFNASSWHQSPVGNRASGSSEANPTLSFELDPIVGQPRGQSKTVCRPSCPCACNRRRMAQAPLERR